MKCPVTLQPDTGGYVVSFPDIPEVHNTGMTKRIHPDPRYQITAITRKLSPENAHLKNYLLNTIP